MSNLTDLVPPLELCKKIPAGEFEDSAFCWIGKGHSAILPTDIAIKQKPFVELRRYTIQGDEIPAPTLKEIMSELSLCDERGDTGWFCLVEATDWSIGNCECDLYVKNGTENKSPEAAALKLWLKLKGIEV